MTMKPPPDPREVETWIFDLDNTLYPATSTVSSQISQKMTSFVADLLHLPFDEARAVQKRMFHQHGTTLRGLMSEHGIDGHAFLDFVHQIDLGELAPVARLIQAIERLPGQKLVHTNASLRHAERVLEQLGLTGHFGGTFDIVDAGFLPKPDPAGYDALIARYHVRPDRACMVEDMAVNLKPAAERGMLTIWVSTHNDWAAEGSNQPWVHYRTDDLAALLEQWADG